MNIYSALHAHADSPIGGYAWGSMVLASVNMQLPDAEKLSVTSTCKQAIDVILNMPPATRTEFLKMDVPGEDVEELKRGARGKIVLVITGALLVAMMLITVFYIQSTGAAGPDKGTLETFFNFMGELLKILTNQPDSGAQ